MATILVLNGPNLNLLGTREPEHYGGQTLDEIRQRMEQLAKPTGHKVEWLQSNAEHVLLDSIQGATSRGVAYIIINPAAFTHTSVALRDGLLATEIPFTEVHLSNIHARESFRSRSYFSDIAQGAISGFGGLGYELALQVALRDLEKG